MSITTRWIGGLTAATATAAAAALAVPTAALAAPAAPATAATTATASATTAAAARARVRVTGASIRGTTLRVTGTVFCSSRSHWVRLVVIAQQPGGPTVGWRPLKSRGETRVRCDRHFHTWSTLHSSRAPGARGNWRHGRRVHVTGTLLVPGDTFHFSGEATPRH
ncbi:MULTISPECIES: hypothetical protein [Thermomonosporaceae]|uniref:hypothetical protein n=1 Tax=Thermomonosporaceae TaxID=2012 RepID=UPI00255AFF6B|nr:MULTISPECIES: hypothetical protein [Thermomonosporaceae]MDL4770775.1 hypothetical protein [Actinomadura xylanilytica]